MPGRAIHRCKPQLPSAPWLALFPPAITTPGTMTQPLTLSVASLPDRESDVVEVWEGDQQVAELSFETNIPVLEIYARPDGSPWTFTLSELQEALNAAKDQLANILGAAL